MGIFSGVSGAELNVLQNEGIIKVQGNFQPLSSVKELPSSIYEILSNEYKDCPGFADPSENFNSSCGSGRGGLPCKKMLYGGHFDDIWFMEYLQGGAGVSRNFYAFKLKDGHTESLLVYQPLSGKQRIVTTEELEQSLSNKTPDCSKNNYVQYRMNVHFGLCEEF